MFKNNQILCMRFQCTDVYGCPKLLDIVKGSKNKGPYIQKDKKPHGGGDQWKVFDKRGKRQGTINDKGEKIRD